MIAVAGLSFPGKESTGGRPSEGKSQEAIAAELEVPRPTVQSIIAAFDEKRSAAEIIKPKKKPKLPAIEWEEDEEQVTRPAAIAR